MSCLKIYTLMSHTRQSTITLKRNAQPNYLICSASRWFCAAQSQNNALYLVLTLHNTHEPPETNHLSVWHVRRGGFSSEIRLKCALRHNYQLGQKALGSMRTPSASFQSGAHSNSLQAVFLLDAGCKEGSELRQFPAGYKTN